VAGWFTRGSSGFREGVGETVGYWSVSVHGSAGRGWGDIEGSMPCRCVRRAELDELQVHGNATYALHALDGPATSVWHGRGVVYGHARAKPTRGIGQWGQGKAGGEATARMVVGGALPTLGVHGGHGDGQVGVVWLESVSAKRGQV
jgi:hypothetical protein